jgi:hypothetical protein
MNKCNILNKMNVLNLAIIAREQCEVAVLLKNNLRVLISNDKESRGNTDDEKYDS